MNEWSFLVQNDWIKDGRFQDGSHHQVESEWMSEVFLCKMAESKLAEFKMAAIINLRQNEWVKFFSTKWLNQGWQISRWLPSSGWVRMNEWSFFLQICWIQDGRILDGRIQDGFHHQVKWERMSLSQIELVWVRVRMEWECLLSESERRKQGVWI